MAELFMIEYGVKDSFNMLKDRLYYKKKHTDLGR